MQFSSGPWGFRSLFANAYGVCVDIYIVLFADEKTEIGCHNLRERGYLYLAIAVSARNRSESGEIYQHIGLSSDLSAFCWDYLVISLHILSMSLEEAIPLFVVCCITFLE